MHGQQNLKKNVEFYCRNKFEKLVHLVGFIIRAHIEYPLYYRSVEITH